MEQARDIIMYNMSLSYGGKELLQEHGEDARGGGNTLKLMRGRRYGFLGNNGCGKTTLLRRFAAGEWPAAPCPHTHTHTQLQRVQPWAHHEAAGAKRGCL